MSVLPNDLEKYAKPVQYNVYWEFPGQHVFTIFQRFTSLVYGQALKWGYYYAGMKVTGEHKTQREVAEFSCVSPALLYIM